MNKLMLVLGMTFLAACGSQRQTISMAKDATVASGDVVVSRDGNGNYAAVLSGDHAASLRAALTQSLYTSPQGGLKIDCNDTNGNCQISIATTAADLTSVHRPEDGGNADLLQVWLTGVHGQNFYLNQTSVVERFISDDLGLKTYEKEVLEAKGQKAAANIDCFRKVIPQFVIFHKTTYECAVNLSGFAAQ